MNRHIDFYKIYKKLYVEIINYAKISDNNLRMFLHFY